MEGQEKKHEIAKKIAKGKTDFIRHLGTYILVILVLAVINNVTDPGSYQWWLWPAGCWGFFVIINFLDAFFFKSSRFKNLEEQFIQRELEKMDREE